MSYVTLIHAVMIVGWILILAAVIRTVLYVCLILVVAVILSSFVPHQTQLPQQPGAQYEHTD